MLPGKILWSQRRSLSPRDVSTELCLCLRCRPVVVYKGGRLGGRPTSSITVMLLSSSSSPLATTHVYCLIHVQPHLFSAPLPLLRNPQNVTAPPTSDALTKTADTTDSQSECSYFHYRSAPYIWALRIGQQVIHTNAHVLM